jgi:hypothetical protein
MPRHYNDEPTYGGNGFAQFTKGWYKVSVNEAVPGVSKGDYNQIKMVMIVDGGQCDGNKIWLDILIPTLDKAYSDEHRTQPTYFMRKMLWALETFGVLITTPGQLKALQNQDTVAKVADKIVGQHAVVLLHPEEYETVDKKTQLKVKRIKGTVDRLRETGYIPAEGLASVYAETDHQPPTPTGGGHVPPPPPPGVSTSQPFYEEEVNLDDDMELEEDENFLTQ